MRPEVAHVVTDHSEHVVTLFAAQRLDHEPGVLGEEKEGAAGAGTLSRLEHLGLVVMHVERIE